MVVLALLIGLAVGGLAAWLVLRERVASARRDVERERASRGEVETTMKALAADALRSNNESFLQLAETRLDRKEQAVEQLVGPIKESLERVRSEVQTLETNRQRDAGDLTRRLATVVETSERVRSETASLTTALRRPEVRGAWGEMQLRNAVESAGMLAYCDFAEQVSTTVDGRVLRADLVVRLPGGRQIVVDANAPLAPLLDAAATDDEERKDALTRDFGRLVREKVAALDAKAYWQRFDPAPDFVILFLPGESFYRAAVEQDPKLLDVGRRRVIVAGPTVLITLLKTIAVGWREEKVAESAAAVSELGRELYERLAVLTEHFVTLGKRLDGAVQAYNQSVGSFERRVLPQARRFADHGVTTRKELPSPAPVERAAQPPQTAELPPRADAA
jgi:DNA recombination protein RmuC